MAVSLNTSTPNYGATSATDTGATGGANGAGSQQGGLSLSSPLMKKIFQAFAALIEDMITQASLTPQAGAAAGQLPTQQGTPDASGSPTPAAGSGTPAPAASGSPAPAASGSPAPSASGTPSPSASGSPQAPTVSPSSGGVTTTGTDKTPNDPTYQHLSKTLDDATKASEKVAANPGAASSADIKDMEAKDEKAAAELQNTPVDELRANRSDVKQKADAFASASDKAYDAVKATKGDGSPEQQDALEARIAANEGRTTTYTNWAAANKADGVNPPKDDASTQQSVTA